MIGSFIVKSKEWPTEFKSSAGSMTHIEKKEAFLNYNAEFHGKIARYSYFPYGVVDVPRHGIFDGIRPVQDL